MPPLTAIAQRFLPAYAERNGCVKKKIIFDQTARKSVLRRAGFLTGHRKLTTMSILLNPLEDVAECDSRRASSST
jgi:hypothetical protein